MRLASALNRSVIFALLWVTLTGGSADALIYGGLAVAAATLLSLRLYPADQPGIVLWRVAGFLPRFLADAFMGGLDVARRALDPRLPIAPGWVRAQLTNRNEAAGVLLGGVVSILPGSLAAGPGDAEMDVHLLNVTRYAADGMQADERRVLGLFDRRIDSHNVANG
ncbi:MAG: Na+/H+ antiporter subunit E [Acetobacteraceae bacterium]|nr:Na+/H+ antiporter subunit E [Acetobacteraceae bacterium]